MLLYEKIKTVVEAGRIAITQDKDWKYCLWSSIDSEWKFRISHYFKTIEVCYDMAMAMAMAMINQWRYFNFTNQLQC